MPLLGRWGAPGAALRNAAAVSDSPGSLESIVADIWSSSARIAFMSREEIRMWPGGTF